MPTAAQQEQIDRYIAMIAQLRADLAAAHNLAEQQAIQAIIDAFIELIRQLGGTVPA